MPFAGTNAITELWAKVKEYVQQAVASAGNVPAGGTTGQVLAKASNTDNDVMWASPASVQEVDPTVPSWAKQSSKPTYTASEVGAAPTSHASSSDTYGKGTSSNYGHVKLSDSTSSTTAAASGGTAATPKAVKDALDAAKAYADGIDVGVTGVKGNSESSYRSGNVNLTAANIGAAASSHTHSYLPLSGGTLTGHVYHDAKYIYCDAGNIDITTPPSSGTSGNSRIALRDKNGTTVAQLIPYIGSSGRYGTQFGTGGNWLYLTTDGTDPYVSMTNAAAWRTGLGLGAAATMNTGATASTVALGNHTHSQYFDNSTSRTANTVLAAPNGSNGAASFRKLVAADIPRLDADHINLNGYSWLTGATPTAIGFSATAYTSVATSGWTYYKFLANGGSMYVYHAFGVVKFKNIAITTAHGSGYINSANLYIRLPVKARVIKSATFGTTMGGGLLGVTLLAAGGTGDWKSTTDSLINLPVRLFSPVSQAAANSNNDNQFIPVDIWFTAAG